MTCSHYPQLLLPDGAVVCWDQPVGVGKAELYVVLEAGTRRVDLFRSPGSMNQPITATRFVSTVSTSVEGAHPDILMYDLTARTCEVLIRGAATLPSPHSVSPNGRRLLVRPFQSGGGLLSVDLRNGRATSLASKATVWDAVWKRGGASVVYAATPHSDPKIVQAHEVELGSMQDRKIWSASLETVSTPRCSPDGRNIAYITGDQLVCHSLESGQRWVVALGRPADLDYVWSPDGSRLAALATGHSAELSVLDVASRRIEKVPLDSGDGVVYPLGWLPDNKHFLVKIVDIRPHQHQVVAVTLLGKGKQARHIR
ncbi:MAG: hypothetical protein QHI38_10570 [Armatimonadota bacterium]|nr:hypothetical protein [Armatimonadota bacterium]